MSLEISNVARNIFKEKLKDCETVRNNLKNEIERLTRENGRLMILKEQNEELIKNQKEFQKANKEFLENAAMELNKLKLLKDYLYDPVSDYQNLLDNLKTSNQDGFQRGQECVAYLVKNLENFEQSNKNFFDELYKKVIALNQYTSFLLEEDYKNLLNDINTKKNGFEEGLKSVEYLVEKIKQYQEKVESFRIKVIELNNLFSFSNDPKFVNLQDGLKANIKPGPEMLEYLNNYFLEQLKGCHESNQKFIEKMKQLVDPVTEFVQIINPTLHNNLKEAEKKTNGADIGSEIIRLFVEEVKGYNELYGEMIEKITSKLRELKKFKILQKATNVRTNLETTIDKVENDQSLTMFKKIDNTLEFLFKHIIVYRASNEEDIYREVGKMIREEIVMPSQDVKKMLSYLNALAESSDDTDYPLLVERLRDIIQYLLGTVIPPVAQFFRVQTLEIKKNGQPIQTIAEQVQLTERKLQIQNIENLKLKAFLKQTYAGLLINEKLFGKNKKDVITPDDFIEVTNALNKPYEEEIDFTKLSEKMYTYQANYLKLEEQKDNLEAVLARYKEVYPDIEFEMSDSREELRDTIQKRNNDIKTLQEYLKNVQEQLSTSFE